MSASMDQQVHGIQLYLDNDVKETLIPLPDQAVQIEISTEVIRRCSEAKLLRSQAETVVATAKARVE